MTSAFHNPTQFRPAPKAPAACLRVCEYLDVLQGFKRDPRNAGFIRIN